MGFRFPFFNSCSKQRIPKEKSDPFYLSVVQSVTRNTLFVVWPYDPLSTKDLGYHVPFLMGQVADISDRRPRLYQVIFVLLGAY